MTISQAIVRLKQLRPDITLDATDNPTIRIPADKRPVIVLGNIEVCLLTGKSYYRCIDGSDDTDPRDRSER